jgi:two-component system, OmpR family, response regulator QseB
VRGQSFDIALVDIGLPKDNGFPFIGQLRVRGRNLPILLLTAHDSIDDTIRGLDAGADDYMTKSYRLPEVAARIRVLIRRSNAIADA